MASNPLDKPDSAGDRWSGTAAPTPEDVGEEYTGVGADALAMVSLKNNAIAFDDVRDGERLMRRTHGPFYRSLRAGLELMRPKK